MLKRKNRLKAQDRLFVEKTIQTPFFVLKVFKAKGNDKRFAFIVSKKIDKRAVIRNRIKRMARACIEKNLEKIKGGVNMLFIAKEKIVTAQTHEICSEIKESLIKNNLMI